MIGISCSLLKDKVPNTITNKRFHLSTDYIEAVSNAGAVCCMLPILKPEQAKVVVNQLNGLILSGGNDVSPQLFSKIIETHPDNSDIILERDLYEIALCKEALRQRKPVLGICRGAQLLNVVTGGTLYTEIKDTTHIQHIQKEKPAVCSHTIKVEKNSVLYTILGKETIEVNSYHHQAVKTLGNSLRLAATSEDGYIEAIEYTGDSFALGLQWHPEILAAHHNKYAEALFAYFIQVVTAYKAQSEAM